VINNTCVNNWACAQGIPAGASWSIDMFVIMPTVLVTGAAQGIGRATTARLAGAGWEVIAGVRKPADGEQLAAAQGGRITPLVLDITNVAQLAALDEALPQRLDAVVNNAGVVVGGPIEAVPLSELRRQLEVNVVGQAAVTQVVLPRLRNSRGRVVFVSSVSGLIATPMTGPYNASKFALEAMADSLRMELAPWGIRVILVEPAQTDTDMWRKAEDDLDQTVAALSPEHRDLYAKHIAGFRRSIPRSQQMASAADGAAAVIERALTVRRPRARYIVGRGLRVQALMAKLTPTAALDVVLRVGTGVPRRP
jgi:NAD(P)-dependent dehydrogenase (short-subunit alcohol dehydrogenase family)